MLKILNVLVVLLFVASSAVAQSDSLAVAVTSESVMTKQEADSLYDKGLYAEAAKAYEDIISNNGVSADLYYNLVNAYYKLDDLARSILNYERALLLDQGDEDVRSNLALARGKTTDKVTPPSEMFFVSWWRDFANMVSVDTWAVVAVVSFVLMLLGIAVYLFMEQIVARKIGFYGAVLFLLFTVVFNLAAMFQRDSIMNRTTAVIMQPVVSVKSSPNDAGTDLFLIHTGSKVEILDDTMSDWTKIKLEEGKEGWVQTGVMEVI